MAVYTRINAQDLNKLLAQYDVGTLTSFHPISAGITNTNYLVITSGGRWILTLFEDMSADELPFFMQVMDHLSKHEVPGAHPVARRDGQFLSTLKSRPAALVFCLEGQSIDALPNAAQMTSLGTVVAHMHQANAQFATHRANPRGLDWIERTAKTLPAHLSAAEQELLTATLHDQQQLAASPEWQQLPTAIIHADIFRDNVLFTGNDVSGIIDFYYACHDFLLFDLAVICNDWCFDEQGQFLPQLWQAFITAYAAVRPPLAVEQQQWPAMLQAAALRFWTSRLYDYHFPASGDVTHIHDPKPLENLLRRYREQPLQLLP